MAVSLSSLAGRHTHNGMVSFQGWREGSVEHMIAAFDGSGLLREDRLSVGPPWWAMQLFFRRTLGQAALCKSTFCVFTQPLFPGPSGIPLSQAGSCGSKRRWITETRSAWVLGDPHVCCRSVLQAPAQLTLDLWIGFWRASKMVSVDYLNGRHQPLNRQGGKCKQERRCPVTGL